MTKLSRRTLLGGGLVAAAGAAGFAAGNYGLIPPDGGSLYGVGETLTYAAQRLLTRHSLAREFPRSEISKTPFANGEPPKDEAYTRPLDWRLTVDGMVAHPGSLSLAELKTYPASNQITHLACEEGWSYIAEWIGVPLHHVLNLAGVLPQARYVVYFSLQPGWWDSIDMADALHPQTLIAYAMNGDELPVKFGGPLRLRVPRQLGYKSVKYITRLTVTDSLKKFGKGLGSAAPEAGYAWYAGI